MIAHLTINKRILCCNNGIIYSSRLTVVLVYYKHISHIGIIVDLFTHRLSACVCVCKATISSLYHCFALLHTLHHAHEQDDITQTMIHVTALITISEFCEYHEFLL